MDPSSDKEDSWEEEELRHSDQENNEEDSSSSGSDGSDESQSAIEDEQETGNASQEDSENDEEHDGLSDYEKLRLARIKRNQQYLAKLGLEKNEGMLGRPKTAPKRKRKRDPAEAHLPKRTTPGRASKMKEVDYIGDQLDLKSMVIRPKGSKAHRPRSSSGKMPPVPRIVYTQFTHIRKQRKENVKIAKRHMKMANKHRRHWELRLHQYQTQQQKLEQERLRWAEMEQERKQLGGKTKLELLSELDRRKGELYEVLAAEDNAAMERKKQEQLLHRHELERKQQVALENSLEWIDTLDRFPKAYNSAVNRLNSMLLRRSPKDPPPPRRSIRGVVPEPENNKTKASKKDTGSPNDSDEPLQLPPECSLAISNVTAHIKPPTIDESVLFQMPDKNDSTSNANTTTTQPQNGKDLSGSFVGGWISPKMSEEMDRSWLTHEKPVTPFDISSYVAQVGDIVLYYPSAHKAFLKVYPDVWWSRTNNQLRTPLWVQAEQSSRHQIPKPASNNKRRSKLDYDYTDPDIEDEELAWWNEEWLDAMDGDDFPYPIICRVERTNAEFPFDPAMDNRIVTDDGQVTWIQNRTTSKGERPRMRLCVFLKPLTPIIPPKWDDTGNIVREDVDLCVPKRLSVLTFPTERTEPFLVPFAWAYALSHSLFIDDSVVSKDENMLKGKITAWQTLGDDYGSMRLDDKVSSVRAMLRGLANVSKEDSGNPNKQLQTEGMDFPLPRAEAAFLIEYLTRYCQQFPAPENEESEIPDSTAPTLMEVVRATLPLHKGIEIRYDFQRKKMFYSRWEISLRKKDDNVLGMSHWFKQGRVHSLENALRMKIEFCIQDLLNKRPEASSFLELVTEDVAPSYYCAVPVGMHFHRILNRLQRNKNNQCYYTSTESVLLDIQSIWENCILYNSPDSFVVSICKNLIPAFRRRITNAYTSHIEEVETGRSSTDAMSIWGGTDNFMSLFGEFLNTPYHGDLDYSWLQTTAPDVAQQDSSKSVGDVTDSSFWIPQAGDVVLYSRSMHSLFVDSQKEYLAEQQQQLPDFACFAEQPLSAKEDSYKKAMLVDVKELENSWIIACVVSVHISFPKDYSEGDDLAGANLPVLILVLRFQIDGVSNHEDIAVCWRPCSGYNEGDCSSFLRPYWRNQKSGPNYIEPNEVVLATSMEALESAGARLDQELQKHISRCFDVLKRRCMENIPPDHLDPNISLENAKNGTLPLVTGHSSRSLPTFEDILKLQGKIEPSSGMETRKIRRPQYENEIPILAQTHYLPVWSSSIGNDRSQNKRLLSYETRLPFPSLCLELIRLRLSKGYYRHLAAIENDLLESYVTSVLFLLLGPSQRSKNRLSIRKIATYLEGNGNGRKDILEKPALQKKSARQPSSKISAEGSTVPIPGEATLGSGLDDFSSEEVHFIERISLARKLYAMAVSCVYETKHLSRLLGLPSTRKLTEQTPVHVEEVSASGVSDEGLKDRRLGISKIRYLLSAIGRDACSNLKNHLGLMRLSVTVGDVRVTRMVPSRRAPDGTVVPAQQIPFVQFSHADFAHNDQLAQVAFRGVGRRAPCARCQVNGASFYTCRMLRKHANPDFDFVANLKDCGGVDGLLEPFTETMTESVLQCAKEDSIHDTVNMTTPLKDPTTQYKMAKRAYEMASFLFHEAKALAGHPAILGRKFIEAVFPIDPSDGHYLWCIICGRSGDVLCCDGCSNVVHADCVGLDSIPDGDWFCDTCCNRGIGVNGVSNKDATTNEESEKADTSPNEIDQNGHNPKERENDELHTELDGKEKQHGVPPTETSSEKESGDVDAINDDESRLSKGFENQAQNPGSPPREPIAPTAQGPTPPKAPPKPILTDDEFEEKNSEFEMLLEQLQRLEGAPRLPASKTSNESAAISVGTIFQKDFGDQGIYTGKVVSVPSGENIYYHVVYEDGDEEDLELKEIQEVMKASTEMRKANSPPATQHGQQTMEEIDDESGQVDLDDQSEEGFVARGKGTSKESRFGRRRSKPDWYRGEEEMASKKRKSQDQTGTLLEPVKRGPGRPRLSPAPDASTPAPSGKRKPGRPPRADTIETSPLPSTGKTNSGRPAPRSELMQISPTPSSGKRKPGRPPKSQIAEDSPPASVPTIAKKRGRPPKARNLPARDATSPNAPPPKHQRG
eukprot:Nitzschia sp. Nitz4//scaffold127_size64804//13733//20288//NITZ4_006174-RA/size64804-augustus-gene-0.51-mRNA-1//1//CDS//3329534744//5079//frame0